MLDRYKRCGQGCKNCSWLLFLCTFIIHRLDDGERHSARAKKEPKQGRTSPRDWRLIHETSVYRRCVGLTPQYISTIYERSVSPHAHSSVETTLKMGSRCSTKDKRYKRLSRERSCILRYWRLERRKSRYDPLYRCRRIEDGRNVVVKIESFQRKGINAIMSDIIHGIIFDF